MRVTKNKYLRRLVRNYEIERLRPKGLKALDLLIRNIPNAMLNKCVLFIGNTIHKEADFITRYKGFEIISASGLKGTGMIATNANVFWDESELA